MSGGALSMMVVDNVRAIRKRLGWSAARLAEALPAELGLSRAVIANLEGGRRDAVTLDELAALAEALKISDPWALTRPEVPPCETCGGNPPPGFRCMVCDAPGTSEVTDGR
jgi:transcriptional regulator with XRE-family HTH domain